MSSHPIIPPSNAPINCGVYSVDNPQPKVASTGYVFPRGQTYATYTLGNTNDMAADAASADSAAIDRVLEMFAAFKTAALAVAETSYRRNPSGNACDAIEDAAYALDDIVCELQIARTGADERENDALLQMERP
jgi:hypothetical protein